MHMYLHRIMRESKILFIYLSLNDLKLFDLKLYRLKLNKNKKHQQGLRNVTCATLNVQTNIQAPRRPAKTRTT